MTNLTPTGDAERLWFWSCSCCHKRSYLRWEYSQDICPFCNTKETFKKEEIDSATVQPPETDQ